MGGKIKNLSRNWRWSIIAVIRALSCSGRPSSPANMFLSILDPVSSASDLSLSFCFLLRFRWIEGEGEVGFIERGVYISYLYFNCQNVAVWSSLLKRSILNMQGREVGPSQRLFHPSLITLFTEIFLILILKVW